MTSPRQQLIKAVEKRLEADCQHAGSCFTDHYADALSGVQVLSDLGAVVLMPVKAGQSVANVIVLDEKHVLRTTQEGRNEGVYVNARHGTDVPS